LRIKRAQPILIDNDVFHWFYLQQLHCHSPFDCPHGDAQNPIHR
jgi:hypothetical protein